MKETKRRKTSAPVADAATPAAPATVAEAAPRTNSRRAFLGQLGGAAAVVAVSDLTLGSSKAKAASRPAGAPSGTWQPLSDEILQMRRDRSLQGRGTRALFWHDQPFSPQLANDDELIYPQKFGNFTKGLPHNGLGHVNPAAYAQLVTACNSGRVEDFDAIPLALGRPLRNPMGGLVFDFCGYDSNQTLVPPAPAFASAEMASEMVELYWMSLLRDVPFSEYGTNPLVAQACADLSAMSDFRGPKEGGLVTPNTIFRGPYAGCLRGPAISQFLLKDFFFGSQPVVQQQRTLAQGTDYFTGYNEWLEQQNGGPATPRVYDPTHRYIRTGRDIATWVDMDPPLQAGLHAIMILLGQGTPLDAAHPYGSRILNQDGFTSLGPVDWFDILGRAPLAAHKGAWFQKWRIHRRTRPEEVGGRVHNHRTGAFSYPLHTDLLNSDAVQESFNQYGTYLLAQAYPDASPLHCAYPSGHSVGSGSTAGVLKALFDETAAIVDPVEPTPDGLSLQPYGGPPLSVRGELNKMAWNVGLGRLFGGIHYRTDVVEGNKLGERMTVGFMRDIKAGYREPFDGYTLTMLSGASLRIT